MTWKRPKPQKWKVGDVFSIGMSDGTFAFGQVVWENYKEPNCALFDCRGRENIISLEDIISSPVISVLQLGSECLDSFEWKVIGNTPVNIDKLYVPLMHRGERSYSAGILSNLVETYYGLEPWNASFSNDEMLLPKIKRPKSAFILTQEQLEEYYKTKGWK